MFTCTHIQTHHTTRLVATKYSNAKDHAVARTYIDGLQNAVEEEHRAHAPNRRRLLRAVDRRSNVAAYVDRRRLRLLDRPLLDVAEARVDVDAEFAVALGDGTALVDELQRSA